MTAAPAGAPGELDDHLVDIIPMIFNHRVVLSPKAVPQTYDAGWCYASLPDAVLALTQWDPAVENEPPGYIKRAV